MGREATVPVFEQKFNFELKEVEVLEDVRMVLDGTVTGLSIRLRGRTDSDGALFMRTTRRLTARIHTMRKIQEAIRLIREVNGVRKLCEKYLAKPLSRVPH